MSDGPLPENLTPVNLQAYMFNAFGACGCSNLEDMQGEVLRLLEWHAEVDSRMHWEHLYPGHPGLFYLLAGRIDALGLSEHGTAIRHPWLTPDGKRLLKALQETPWQDIENASGEAYDGAWYGR